jgi:hypothetical protein
MNVHTSARLVGTSTGQRSDERWIAPSEEVDTAEFDGDVWFDPHAGISVAIGPEHLGDLVE